LIENLEKSFPGKGLKEEQTNKTHVNNLQKKVLGLESDNMQLNQRLKEAKLIIKSLETNCIEIREQLILKESIITSLEVKCKQFQIECEAPERMMQKLEKDSHLKKQEAFPTLPPKKFPKKFTFLETKEMLQKWNEFFPNKHRCDWKIEYKGIKADIRSHL
jgi:chromosome segregation ATPase